MATLIDTLNRAELKDVPYLDVVYASFMHPGEGLPATSLVDDPATEVNEGMLDLSVFADAAKLALIQKAFHDSPSLWRQWETQILATVTYLKGASENATNPNELTAAEILEIYSNEANKAKFPIDDVATPANEYEDARQAMINKVVRNLKMGIELLTNLDAQVTEVAATGDGEGVDPVWIAVGAGAGLLTGGFIMHRIMSPKIGAAKARGKTEGRTAGEAAKQGEVDTAVAAQRLAEGQLAAFRTHAAEFQAARAEVARIETEFERRIATGEAEASLQAALGPQHAAALGNMQARLVALDAAVAGTPAPLDASAAIPLPPPVTPVPGAPVDMNAAMATLEPQVRALETRLGITAPVGDMNARLTAIQTRVDAEVAARTAAEARAATGVAAATTPAEVLAAREYASAVDALRTLQGDLQAQKAAFEGGPAADPAGRYDPANLPGTHTAFAGLGELRTRQAELASLNSRLGTSTDAANANGSLYAQRKALGAQVATHTRSGDTSARAQAQTKLDAVNSEITRSEPRRAALAKEVKILELEARQAALPGEIAALEAQIDTVRYELGDPCRADPTGAREPAAGVNVPAKRTELAGLVGRLRSLQGELSTGAAELARLKPAATTP